MSVFNLLKHIVSHPLTSDAKSDAIVRFLKWQIGSRLVPGEVVVNWINGSRFFVRNGETGLTQNIYTGLHEFPDMGYLLHVMGEGELFVDVGANVGSYTILACAAKGAKGVAFEPVPTTYKRLVENIGLNHLENRVKSFNVGLGHQMGFIAFTSDLDTMNHAVAEGEKRTDTIDVKVTTLDLALKDESPSLIKIDVEGYETPVLEGATETLKRRSLHSVIMELNGSGKRFDFDEARILELMFDNGFQTFSYDPFRRELISLKGKNVDSGNTLFVRDATAVLDRLAKSPMVNILGKSF